MTTPGALSFRAQPAQSSKTLSQTLSEVEGSEACRRQAKSKGGTCFSQLSWEGRGFSERSGDPELVEGSPVAINVGRSPYLTAVGRRGGGAGATFNQ